MFHLWNATINQIRVGKVQYIIQMGLLGTELIKFEYRIFIHEFKTECYETVLEDKNERTNKSLRPVHNLFN